MTAKELYEKLVSMGLENVELRVQYRDDGGDYYGYDSLGDENDYGINYDEKENAIYL